MPRASLTLNVFEPRYLALVDHALGGDRLIGVVQPAPEAGKAESPSGKTFPLRRVGCGPQATVLIGDTPYDVEAGARAGVAVIAFRSGGWSDAPLQGALALYDGAADLLDRWDGSPLAGGPS